MTSIHSADALWARLLAATGAGEDWPLDDAPEASSLARLYRPLVEGRAAEGRPWVLAHLATSLDGRIALPDGESQWISGEPDLVHTHRLRALVDAVVVGARTVQRDDPQLTVRRVPGPSPLRVVLDLRGRLDGQQRLLSGEGPPTVVFSARPRPALAARGVEVEVVEAPEGVLEPARVLERLAARGIERVLVEGGGVTVSRFVAAHCVDRLHLVVAPLLVGQGRPALSRPLGTSLELCPRPPTQVVPLGQDWLFDCDLSA